MELIVSPCTSSPDAPIVSPRFSKPGVQHHDVSFRALRLGSVAGLPPSVRHKNRGQLTMIALSMRDLGYAVFTEAWPDRQIVQQPAAHLSWSSAARARISRLAGPENTAS